MAVHDIPLDSGFLIGLCVGLILYGVYCTLFVITLYTRRRCETRNCVITGAVVALFLMCTIIIALHIVACYNQFIKSESINATRSFFVDPLKPHQDWYPVRDILILCSTLIAEALLMWRLYMVWSQNWKMLVLPVLVWLLIFCAGTVTIVAEVLIFVYPIEKAKRIIPLFTRVSPVGLAATLANNLLCTILIVGKLWWITRAAEGRATARMANPAVSALIESGILYTSVVLCMKILASTGMNGVNLMFIALLPVIIGIAPTTIVLRLNLIAPQKTPPRTVQNEVSVVQFAQSSMTYNNSEGQNKPRLVHLETGVATMAEPVFARPSMTGFTSSTAGDSVDQTSGFDIEAPREEKFPNSLIP